MIGTGGRRSRTPFGKTHDILKVRRGRMAQQRSSLLFLSVIAFCSVLGGIFGPGLQPVSASDTPEEDMKSSIKQFTKVFDLVEANAAEKVSSDKGIYKG